MTIPPPMPPPRSISARNPKRAPGLTRSAILAYLRLRSARPGGVTLRALADAVGVRERSTVHYHVRELVRLGLATMTPGACRTIRAVMPDVVAPDNVRDLRSVPFVAFAPMHRCMRVSTEGDPALSTPP